MKLIDIELDEFLQTGLNDIIQKVYIINWEIVAYKRHNFLQIAFNDGVVFLIFKQVEPNFEQLALDSLFHEMDWQIPIESQ